MGKYLWFSIILFNVQVIFAQKPNVKFETITSTEGLSHNSVSAIIQDSYGYMWFGTGNGLSRYDGYEFITYKHQPNDHQSISHNVINDIALGPDGVIWAATKNGVSALNVRNGVFKNYIRDSINIFRQEVQDFHEIYVDIKGTVWIGSSLGVIYSLQPENAEVKSYEFTSEKIEFRSIQEIKEAVVGNDTMLLVTDSNGLMVFDEASDSFVPYLQGKDLLVGYDWNSIKVIFKDKLGVYWISCPGIGLFKYDPVRQNTVLFEYDADHPIFSSFYFIVTICNDLNGDLWFGTQNKGLILYKRKENKFYSFQQNYSILEGLSDNNVHACFVDRTNVLWIATAKGGLNKADLEQKEFRVMKHHPLDNNSLTDNSIFSIYEGSDGLLWIGTKYGNVNLYNRQKDFVTRIYNVSNSPSGISGHVIGDFCEDPFNNVWMINWYGYVSKYSKGNKTFHHYSKDNSNLSGWSFRNCYCDADGKVLFASFDAGIEYYNPETGGFHTLIWPDSFRETVNKIKAWTVIKSKDGKYWIGTDKHGAICYDPDEHKIKQYYDTGADNSISNNSVKTIFEETNGVLWLGTEFGLNRLNPETDEVKPFYTTDGLCNNSIYGIEEDEEGNLWISTDYGLSRFDKELERFKNYYTSHGLPDHEFNIGAHYKSPTTKELYFGTNKGLLVFNPESILPNPYPPKVIVNKFMVFDKTINVGDKINKGFVLESPIMETKEITLTHKNYVFSFQFAALHYASPQNNQYLYKLEGFDQTWRNADANNRTASYSNIDPGKYKFRVKASNGDGLWSEMDHGITLVIKPPYWNTLWFKILMVLIILGLVIILQYLREKQVKVKKNELEQLVAIRTKELVIANELLERKQKEILVESEKNRKNDQLKLQFFTNISHEFKTPLTMILGPIEKIIQSGNDLPEKTQHLPALIKRNSLRLLRLINQMLDTSSYEAGALKLRLVHGNIITFIDSIVQSFNYVAEYKGIEYVVNYNTRYSEVYFDQDKIEKVIYNLLSNAFKYTSKNGRIRVYVLIVNAKKLYPRLNLWVQDNGVGITVKNKNRIFERFFQDRSPDKFMTNGTGIGLSLTKNLVELHKGTVSVFSVENLGSIFKVSIPLDYGSYEGVEVSSKDNQHNDNTLYKALAQISDFKHSKSGSSAPASGKALILLVEDNIELRNYIASELRVYYNVIECSNGLEGFEKSKELLPEIIISDVMMPVLDGISMVRKLNQSVETSHIPSILLTAKESEETRLEGYETGASSFLAKPFSMDLLLVRIKNLLDTQIKFRNKFSFDNALSNILTNSPDEKFMNAMMENLEKNLSNPDFNVELLSENLDMNRTQLYRKIVALTNETPGGFIKKYRLRKAKQTLSQHKLRVSEVAYSVGFKDPSYFTKCFVKEYGINPSDYSMHVE